MKGFCVTTSVMMFMMSNNSIKLLIKACLSKVCDSGKITATTDAIIFEPVKGYYFPAEKCESIEKCRNKCKCEKFNEINCVDIPVSLAYLFVFDCYDSDSKKTY